MIRPLKSELSYPTQGYVTRALASIDQWHADFNQLLCPATPPPSLNSADQEQDTDTMRLILSIQLYYSKLWVLSVALRGASLYELQQSGETQKLAFQAKDAAIGVLDTVLSTTYEDDEEGMIWRYAIHDSLVMLTFSALFVLKFTRIFVDDVDALAVVVQVQQVVQLLSDSQDHLRVYADTLRMYLSGLVKRITLTESGVSSPSTSASASGEDEPPELPFWLTEEAANDLGFPENVRDGVLLSCVDDENGNLMPGGDTEAR